MSAASGGKPRILVMASGEGSNFEALARAALAGEVGVEIAGLVCDKAEAPCLARAARLGIPSRVLRPPKGLRAEGRPAYDAELALAARAFSPDFVFLLGWMRVLGRSFLDAFPGRVVNLHPALPGAHPGLKAVERAHETARRGGAMRTGVMLHLVPDEGVDSGPVLELEEVPIGSGESLEELYERVHEAERRIVLRLAGRIARDAAEGRGLLEEGRHA